MLIKILKILFPALCLASTFAADEVCGQGKIKYTYKQKAVVKDLKFCLKEEKRGVTLYSEDCQGLSCQALKDPAGRPVNIGKYPDSIGSPGFKVCRELGGTPQIIEFQFKEKFKDKWLQSSRCMFGSKTFASNNLLMKLWKGFIVD